MRDPQCSAPNVSTRGLTIVDGTNRKQGTAWISLMWAFHTNQKYEPINHSCSCWEEDRVASGQGYWGDRWTVLASSRLRANSGNHGKGHHSRGHRVLTYTCGETLAKWATRQSSRGE